MRESLKTLRFEWEPIRHLRACGLDDLAEASWQETWANATYLHHAPDWPRYEAMEDANAMRIVGARNRDNALVGYAVVLMGSDLHDRQAVTAVVQDIYVAKGYNGIPLLRWVMKQVQALGAMQLVIAERLNARRPVDKVFAHLGFVTNEVLWVRHLKKRAA